ncbi:hypothetical protein CXG81DRAFT_23557 [Caulochytrium protostelioides]|uniref:Uncharacterized protein n=1 Tax=Caulochytrium protostelioides TaxID=1555241 RepID=A0A4P9XE96_9FUNG|nr:hypothetical protein CXG81DRAFT_23557 [Caulochytrium protostelioides]|eukprot:RKP03866.1 hypothetical protein CXG81DRAFT_23557 [Caulochytrium protostelioides]
MATAAAPTAAPASTPADPTRPEHERPLRLTPASAAALSLAQCDDVAASVRALTNALEAYEAGLPFDAAAATSVLAQRAAAAKARQTREAWLALAARVEAVQAQLDATAAQTTALHRAIRQTDAGGRARRAAWTQARAEQRRLAAARDACYHAAQHARQLACEAQSRWELTVLLLLAIVACVLPVVVTPSLKTVYVHALDLFSSA